MDKILPVTALLSIFFIVFFYFNKKNIPSKVKVVLNYIYILVFLLFLISYFIKYFIK